MHRLAASPAGLAFGHSSNLVTHDAHPGEPDVHCLEIDFVTLLALATLVGATSIVTMPRAHAATAHCFANTCTGLNPQAAIGPNGYYCSSDARTLDPYATKGSGGDVTSWGMRIELRYSSNCNAAWVRFTSAWSDVSTYSGHAWVLNSVRNRQDAPFGCPATINTTYQSFSSMVSDTTGQVAWACEGEISVGAYACTGKY